MSERIRQRDLGIAAAIGGLLALSPLSSPNLGLSLVVGAGGAALFLGYRMYFGAAPEPAAADGVEPAAADAAMAIPLAAALCLLLFAATLAPTLAWLYGSWTESIWINTHGLFIPPVMAYMGWDILRRDESRQAESSPWGFAFLVPGLTAVVMDGVMGTQYFAVLGLVICLPGLSLLFLGTRRTRLLAFPLFLGVFMIPVPGTFDTTLFLREMTAVGAEVLLQAQGFSVIRSDTVLEMAWGNVLIAKACSGLSTLYSSITVASILIYYSQTPRRRWTIVLLTLPLALVANVLRALVLVMSSQRWGTAILDTQFHEATGVGAFAIVLVILYMVSDMPGRTRSPA